MTPEKLMEICTDERNTEENWAAIMEMCELVNSENHKKIASYILLRLFHKNPHVSKQAITLLDACMKNCCVEFQNEIVSGAQFRKEAKRNLASMHSQNRALLLKTISQWVGQVKTKESPNELLTSISTSYEKDVKILEEEEKLRANSRKKTVQQEEQELAEAIAASLQNARGPGVTSMSALSAYPTLDLPNNTNSRRSPAATLSTVEEPKRVRALYDFEAAEDNELTFKAGEIILVTDSSDANWWKGSNQRGEGLFPSSFVTAEDKSPGSGDETPSSQLAPVTNANSVPMQESSIPLRIDEAVIDQCLELLGEADPTTLDDSSMPDLATLETRCYQMTPLLDVELERIDREHNELMDLNRRLVDAMQMYNQLMMMGAVSMPAAGGGGRMPPNYGPPNTVYANQQAANGVYTTADQAASQGGFMPSQPGPYMPYPAMQQQQQVPTTASWMPQNMPNSSVGPVDVASNQQYNNMQPHYAPPASGENWSHNPRAY